MKILLLTIKLTILITGGILFSGPVNGQVPEKMNYQAVIRDAEGNLITGQAVGMQISILQGSTDGAVVYTETITPPTNANGLVSVEIGSEAAFADIDWSAGPYYIRTETDPSGGTEYTITGVSQLLSVPFALHARTAESVSEAIVEEDPVFAISPAANIAIEDISNWDQAHSWGDHTQEGYMTGYTVTEEDVTSHQQALQITEEQITDLQNYLTEEVDPIFAASPAAGIVDTDITKWDQAHMWGDHSSAEYLTEEADPVFAASVASEITQENIESWDAKSEFDGEFSSLTGVPNSVIMPAGVINIFAGNIAPDGYLICDGREVSRTEYADLFAVIGTAYGEGDGSTTFNLPDLQSRIPVGMSAEPEFDQLGKTGGAKEHVLTVDEMPAHSHAGSTGEAGGHNHGGNTSSSGGHSHTGSTATAGAHSHSGTTSTTGGHSHSYSRRNRTLNNAGGIPEFYEAGGLSTVNTSTAGDHSHSLTTSTAGGHTHSLSISTVADHSHFITTDGSHDHSVSIGESGGGNSHNNLQPYIVLNFIIKY